MTAACSNASTLTAHHTLLALQGQSDESVINDSGNNFRHRALTKCFWKMLKRLKKKCTRCHLWGCSWTSGMGQWAEQSVHEPDHLTPALPAAFAQWGYIFNLLVSHSLRLQTGTVSFVIYFTWWPRGSFDDDGEEGFYDPGKHFLWTGMAGRGRVVQRWVFRSQAWETLSGTISTWWTSVFLSGKWQNFCL